MFSLSSCRRALLYTITTFVLAGFSGLTGTQPVKAGEQDADRGSAFNERITISLADQPMPSDQHEMQMLQEGFAIESGADHAEWVSEAIAVPAEGAEPFLALAGSWDADTPDPHLIDIHFRTSEDGDIWDDWIEAGYDPHTEEDSELYHSNLVFADKETRYIQYRIVLHRHEEEQNPLVREVKLHFISPGATSDPVEQELFRLRPENRRTASVPPSEDGGQGFMESSEAEDGQPASLSDMAAASQDDLVTYPLPEYVDRETWGEEHDLSNTANRTVTDVSHLIVHHSAGETNADDFAAVVRSYWDFHTHGRNWGDIGYNWLVDGNGVIYQGRAFDLDGSKDVRGAHFSGFNSYTMGICVIGNYNQQMPTGDALFSLKEMLAWKSSELEIDPLAEAYHYGPDEEIYHISGHRDSGVYTDCPGHQMYDYLPDLRLAVDDLLDEFFTPVDYFIPQGDHDAGFASLSEAVDWINDLDTLETNIRFFITDDLDETGEEIALMRAFRQYTQLQILPYDDASPVITLDHPLTISSSYVTIDGDGGNGNQNLGIRYKGEDSAAIHIASGSGNIRLTNLEFTRDDEAEGSAYAVATGSDTGEQGPNGVVFSGNTAGNADHPFTKGFFVSAGYPSDLDITVNDIFASKRAVSFGAQGFDVTISGNRLHTTSAGALESSGLHLDGGGFTVENNIIRTRVAPGAQSAEGIRIARVWDDMLFANNMVTLEADAPWIADGTQSGDNAGGDGLAGSTSATGIGLMTDYADGDGEVRIYHNSLLIDLPDSDGTSRSLAASGENGSAVALDVRNNLFVNQHETTGAGLDGAVGLMLDTDIEWHTEANNWYVPENALQGYFQGEEADNPEAFRSLSGDDKAVSTPVAFTLDADENLLLDDPSKGDTDLTGVSLADVVPLDFTGKERHPVFPYMGVHEPEPSLSPMLTGEYHIPQGDYENGFSSLGEALATLNANGAEGHFRFIIHEDQDETDAQLLLERDDLSSSTRMEMVPGGADITIYLADPFLIKNTSHVTIDGGEERDFDFRMEDEGAVQAIWIAGSNRNVSLKNLSFSHEFGTGANVAAVQVRRDDDATAVPQAITLEGLHIGSLEHPFKDGIRLWGTGDPVLRVRADVRGSHIYASHRGITTFYVENSAFRGNEIDITGTYADQSWYAGIYLAGTRSMNTRENQIRMHGVNTASPGYVSGININLNEGQLTFINNMISVADELESHGDSDDNRTYGIAVNREGQGERYNMFHNTVYVGDTGQTGRSAAFGWEISEEQDDPADFMLMNNLFSNRHDHDNAYAYYWYIGNFMNVQYNNLDVAGDAYIGSYKGETAESVSDWSDITGVDENSTDVYVHYRSPADLRLTGDSEGDQALAGSYMAAVTTDIFGNERNDRAPYKGAWESLDAVLTDAEDERLADAPAEFQLKQNYPNPFNPDTQIRFDLPEDADVRLVVYDVTGQRITTLVNEQMSAGSHTVRFDASGLASGVYIYRIVAGDFVQSRQMTFVK
ncbi:N-acetylmuramoyl-L-alanine amidase [Natronogracilivirgula saccharolytica]|uniref:N-acetylmuramoyl-L-alanine amidase n=1 Tax=Natronogracilivirga saccharolytica TaxID=2812953 RepID=A0A8J7RLT0_9BACT|nr:N-acetylmuramoyl-L-alanine amidase [Natronogracilivirga saccharolytica]